MAKLNLPRALVFVVVSVGAAVGVTCGDGGTTNTADGGRDCNYRCYAISHTDAGLGSDAGVVTCPMCSDEMSQCPAGCERIGLA